MYILLEELVSCFYETPAKPDELYVCLQTLNLTVVSFVHWWPCCTCQTACIKSEYCTVRCKILFTLTLVCNSYCKMFTCSLFLDKLILQLLNTTTDVILIQTTTRAYSAIKDKWTTQKTPITSYSVNILALCNSSF